MNIEKIGQFIFSACLTLVAAIFWGVAAGMTVSYLWDLPSDKSLLFISLPVGFLVGLYIGPKLPGIMLEEQCKTPRWLEHFQNIEGVLLLLSSLGGAVYLAVLGYEFFIAGAAIKFTLLLVVDLALLLLAVRSSSLLGLLPLLVFVFILGLCQ